MGRPARAGNQPGERSSHPPPTAPPPERRVSGQAPHLPPAGQSSAVSEVWQGLQPAGSTGAGENAQQKGTGRKQGSARPASLGELGGGALHGGVAPGLQEGGRLGHAGLRHGEGGGGMHAQVTPDASRTKHHSIAGDAGGTRLQCVAACFMAACACRWAASSPGWCMHARRGPHLELQALGAHIVLVDALEAGGAGLGLSIKRGCKVEGVR